MSEQDALRILLVDDHPVVRRGVVDIILDAFPRARIKELSAGTEAVASVRTERWSLVILDLTLPDGSGIEVLKNIKKAQPDVPVMILSVHPAEEFARRVLAAGASGYLTKAAAEAELTTAVAHLLDGGHYFGDQMLEQIVCPARSADDAPHEKLSDREYEVLRFIGEGKTVSEVARTLTLSVKTVSTYRTRLMKKMGMRTNAQLVHYAVRTGLIKS